ncbi:hypothetical protein PIB30_096943, partial [Stylosanthes scabra]|nr:hypothetical protein [Stylosanthes scabra]
MKAKASKLSWDSMLYVGELHVIREEVKQKPQINSDSTLNVEYLTSYVSIEGKNGKLGRGYTLYVSHRSHTWGANVKYPRKLIKTNPIP